MVFEVRLPDGNGCVPPAPERRIPGNPSQIGRAQLAANARAVLVHQLYVRVAVREIEVAQGRRQLRVTDLAHVIENVLFGLRQCAHVSLP